MFSIFTQLRGLIKQSTINIDNNVFSLHYKFTVMLLIGFSVMIGTRQYFGDPIDCTATGGDGSPHMRVRFF